jgi:uncharacterized protein (DUF302 family)
MAIQNGYAFHVKLSIPYAMAFQRISDALKTEGFGILTKVDMRATLREKLGKEFRDYSILGACNPQLAERALSLNLDAGLMLPCPIVVFEEDGHTSVSIANPVVVVERFGDETLRPIAVEAQQKLQRVLAALVENA